MLFARKSIQSIYRCLVDDISRDIFSNRLLYSLTDDAKYIRNIVLLSKEGKRFAKRISDAQSYLFGGGVWGEDLIRIWENNWCAVLDNDQKKQGDKIGNIPIIAPKSVMFEDYDNVVISSRLYYKEISSELISMGLSKRNIINIGKVLDDLSKRQYFDLDSLYHDEKEVFVDLGCFDGETTIQFMRWSDRSKSKAYCFEPDEKNVELCRNKLRHYISKGTVTIINRGAWSEEAILYLTNSGKGTSSIAEMGVSVNVNSIDNELDDCRVTFIKMDIEGSEMEALKGAERTIRKHRPKLAISVYHKPQDIVEIPSFILSLHPDYNIYLRHYSLSSYETVLYAI